MNPRSFKIKNYSPTLISFSTLQAWTSFSSIWINTFSLASPLETILPRAFTSEPFQCLLFLRILLTLWKDVPTTRVSPTLQTMDFQRYPFKIFKKPNQCSLPFTFFRNTLIIWFECSTTMLSTSKIRFPGATLSSFPLTDLKMEPATPRISSNSCVWAPTSVESTGDRSKLSLHLKAAPEQSWGGKKTLDFSHLEFWRVLTQLSFSDFMLMSEFALARKETNSKRSPRWNLRMTRFSDWPTV